MTVPDNIHATVVRSAHLGSFYCFCRFRYLLIAIIGFQLINLIAPTAHAQQLDVNDFILSTNIAGSWWPQRASLTCAPRLQLGMASLSRLNASVPQSSNFRLSDRRVQPAGDVAENPSGLEAYDATRRGGLSFSFTESDPPSQQSFFSLIETKYVTWEANFAETKTLTYANGAFVYPLLQLNYAQLNLPVTLYVPPLRGTEVSG